jgi:hypothetical protein
MPNNYTLGLYVEDNSYPRPLSPSQGSRNCQRTSTTSFMAWQRTAYNFTDTCVLVVFIIHIPSPESIGLLNMGTSGKEGSRVQVLDVVYLKKQPDVDFKYVYVLQYAHNLSFFSCFPFTK